MGALGAVMALVSLYGWWFHFSVGPTHGPGFELAILAGLLSAAGFVSWWRLRGRS